MLTIILFLKKVNDPRPKLGKRHPLWLISLSVIMRSMFGYLGYRYLGSLAKCNQKVILKTFHVTTDIVLSYFTIPQPMMLVKSSDLIDAFNQWASQITTSSDLNDWVSIN
jgi:hypothetical protein